MALLYNSPQLDSAFEALANSKRRGIVQVLAFRPATVSQLAEEFELSLPALHRHIRTLEAAQLIQRKKVGRTNFVALSRPGLCAVQDWVLQYRTEWGNDEETLENYIASLKDDN